VLLCYLRIDVLTFFYIENFWMFFYTIDNDHCILLSLRISTTGTEMQCNTGIFFYDDSDTRSPWNRDSLVNKITFIDCIYYSVRIILIYLQNKFWYFSINHSFSAFTRRKMERWMNVYTYRLNYRSFFKYCHVWPKSTNSSSKSCVTSLMFVYRIFTKKILKMWEECECADLICKKREI